MGEERPVAGTSDRERGSILIVDDLPENLIVLSGLLSRQGYETRPALGGPLALMAVRERLPDLVLLDIKMPDMDGYAVCRRLKEDPATRDVPVIFISGLDDPDHLVEGFEAGGVDYITKPFVEKVVMARIRTHLRLHRLQSGLERQVRTRTSELRKTNRRLEAEILERRRIEDSLRESEERYRAFIAGSLEGIYRYDLTPPMPVDLPVDAQVPWLLSRAQVAECNDIYARMYGFESGEAMVGSALSEKWGGDLEAGKKLLRDWIRSGYRFPDYEGREITREGERKWFLNSGFGIVEEGCLTGFWGTQIDVTQRRNAEAEILRAKEEWEQTFDAISDLILIIDTDYRIIRVNRAMADVMGMAPDDAVGLTCHSQLHGSDTPLLNCPHRKFLEGEFLDKAEFFDSFGGREYHLTVTPILDAEGRLTASVHIARDITEVRRAEEEQKKLERQLQQTQKMEAIGTLAGGIAHDFNNIIGALNGFTELAQDYLEMGDVEEVRENLEEILTAGMRSRDLVKRILSFSRPAEQKREPMRMDRVLEEVLKLLRASLPATIRMVQKGDPGDLFVLGDATQIHQVIMNLCTNAFHAMGPQGGELTVALKALKSVAGEADALPELGPGPHVRLSVRDTGHGIPADIMAHIFDPFFTTKPKGEGAGLGLSVVHGIVKAHKGAIRVSSSAGEGTVMRIYLPLLDAAQALEGEEAEAVPGGRERILMVDDDAALVRSAKLRLEMLGYQVTATTSALEAIEAFRRDSGAWDLVITDMTMPEMTGAELATELTALRPNIPIILWTGYSELITAEQAAEMGICEFVMKPFDKKQIARAIRRALSGAAEEVSERPERS